MLRAAVAATRRRLGQLRPGRVLEQAAAAATRRSGTTRPPGPPPRDGPRAGPCAGQQGAIDEAIAVFRDLAGRRPGTARHLGCLGRYLKQRGRAPEAAESSTEAVAAFREAIRLKPDDAEAHFNLGIALRPGEARRGRRRIPRGDPAQARLRRAHINLGIALNDRGSSTRRSPHYREAIRLKPDVRRGPQQPRHRPAGRRGSSTRPSPNTARRSGSSPTCRCPLNLGDALQAQGKLDEAVAEYREAIRLKPDYAGPTATSASPCATRGQARRGRSPNSARRSGSSPTTPRPTTTSALALHGQGKLDEAIAEYREAIRLKPDYAEAHFNLGIALEPGQARRGDRRIPRGDPAQARPRRPTTTSASP